MNQSIVKEKIVYLINPVSGTSQKKHLPELILELNDKNIFEPEVIFTRYKGEATEIVAEKLKANCRYFVAVGGDGTVNEIAKSLVNTPGILGIIPIGSGNGLARHLKIPLDPKKAIATINQQKYLSIDYGMINDVPFFCTCGVGFDALIGEKFAKSKGRGLSTYVKTTISEYYNYIPESYQLTIDNNPPVTHKAFLVSFANASQYGNDAYISPNADICDGKLDICILSPFKLWNAPGIGARLFLKNIDKSKLLNIIQGSRVLLERSEEGVVHFDGEPCRMGKRLEISVIAKGLKVIIP
ncbi:MAG: diacylglycerol kinase family protein [Mariniphaga sp.]